MRTFRVALTFLTVIPAGIKFFRGPDELARSASFFPLVGLLLGFLTAAPAALARDILPPGPLIVLVLAGFFFLTRGLHLDGLADTADGLVGGLQRERALAIMKDGPVGPMGAAVVVLVYLLKYAALSSADSSLLLMLILLMPVSGRWSMVLAGSAFGPARKDGLGSQFIQDLSWGRFALSSLVPLAVLSLVGWGNAALAGFLLSGMIAALAVSFLCALLSARRLGGLTGDVLGAVNEIAETAFLLGALAGWGFWMIQGVPA